MTEEPSNRLRPKKALGQNFLRDPNLIRKIIAAVEPEPGDLIVEYGCGTGALTRPLVASGARVIGLEVDRDLIPLLREDPTLAGLELIPEGLEFWPPKRIAEQYGVDRLKLVGNLPYQLSSEALFAAVAGVTCVERVIFMLQREVAERVQTGPGSRRYGILPALIQAHFTVKRVLDAGPKAFYPAPDVKSRVLCLTPLAEPRVDPEMWDRYNTLVRLLFRERRKQIRSLIRKFYFLDDSYLLKLDEDLDIDLSRRPETLSIEEMTRLARALPERQQDV
ncbi:MAG: ribosomal RNA small subunit methyltransferase A [bacterium]|nr:ribosomal RNA small subunit methyltransferase A [bacterium]